MPTLAKLFDCLKWPRAAAGGTPVRPRGEVVPVCDPELTFGWQGNLFTDSGVLGAQAANFVLCSVTIPDDCFYILDATANKTGSAAAQVATRLALQILDPTGNIAYSLVFAFIQAVASAVGMSNTPPAEIYNMRMHLPAGAVVRWRLIDATIATDLMCAAISIRKLYEENI